MARADFGFMYALTKSGSTFTLGSLDTTTVTVKDILDSSSDNKNVLGDVNNDQFQITHARAFNGINYHFVSLADIGGVSGFIATEGNNYFFITNQNASSQIGQQLHKDSGQLQLCFMPGTRIRTPSGEVMVEDIRKGDVVQTTDGRLVPVCWIGRQTVKTLFVDELRLPIRVRVGALGENAPTRDLLLSPDHALYVEGVLAQAGALVNGTSIVRELDVPGTFTYYHLEVDDHSLILAENTPAETFVDNAGRMAFDNWDEFEELYPEGKAIVEMPYPRAKAYRQVPQGIRQMLAERGMALYGEQISAVAWRGPLQESTGDALGGVAAVLPRRRVLFSELGREP